MNRSVFAKAWQKRLTYYEEIVSPAEPAYPSAREHVDGYFNEPSGVNGPDSARGGDVVLARAGRCRRSR